MTTAGVIIDLAAGHAVVGDQTFDVSPAGDGIAVGTMVLRPLSFGERLRVVVTNPNALGAAVLAAARVSGELPTDESRAAVEAMALHLAGARLDPVPLAFADALATVTRTYGWPAAEVAQAHADLVDRLAREVSHPEDGWTHIVLASATNDAIPDAAAVRDRLAADLLRRGGAGSLMTGVSEVGPGGQAGLPTSRGDTGSQAGWTTAGTRVRTITPWASAGSAVAEGDGGSLLDAGSFAGAASFADAGSLADGEGRPAIGAGAPGRSSAGSATSRGAQGHAASAAASAVRIADAPMASLSAVPMAGATGAHASATSGGVSPDADSSAIEVGEHSANSAAAAAAIPAATAAAPADAAAAASRVHAAAAGSTASMISLTQPAAGSAAPAAGWAGLLSDSATLAADPAARAVASAAISSIAASAASNSVAGLAASTSVPAASTSVPAASTSVPAASTSVPAASASVPAAGASILAGISGVGSAAAPAVPGSPSLGESIVDLADHLAALLDDEADLRGVMR